MKSKKVLVLLTFLMLGMLMNVASGAINNSKFLAYWTMDNTADDALGLHNGTLANNALFNGSIAILGTHSLELDGDNDYMNVGDIDSTELSFGCWIYPRDCANTDDNRIMYKQNEFGSRISNNVSNAFIQGFTTVTWHDGGALEPCYAWQHIAWVSDQTNQLLKSYVNGTNKANITAAEGTKDNSALALAIGEDIGANTYGFDGFIDECWLYEGTLTGDDILIIMASQYPYAEPATLTVNTDMVNNTVNINDPNLTINYNGTFGGGYTTDLANCTLLNNGATNQTDTNVNLSINQDFVVDFGPSTEQTITFSISCENYEVSDSTNDFVYKIDRVNPLITTDFVNNTQYQKVINKDITLNVTFSDTNMFAYNVTVRQDNGTLINNVFVENLTATSYSNSTSYDADVLDLGNYTIYLTAWDSHTAKEVMPKDISMETYGYDFNGIKIVSDTMTDKSYTKLKDRYTFEFTYAKGDDWQNIDITSDSNTLWYLPDSDYQGHFVDFEKGIWIDFESDNTESINVIKNNNNDYTVQVKGKTGMNTLTFHSIGDLNRADTGFGFEVLSCPESWAEAFTACAESGFKTRYYLDANSCGTTDDLPANNGTLVQCTYQERDPQGAAGLLLLLLTGVGVAAIIILRIGVALKIPLLEYVLIFATLTMGIVIFTLIVTSLLGA